MSAEGSTRQTIGYQPALDGVRALAVLAVLLFHAEVSWMQGGYLGVSVFFTLSGFLITSLLVVERERAGRVAIGAFYLRRARRLLPASILCVALIVVLSAVTDWFAGVAELRRQVIGALLQVANWVFLAGEGSYQELFQQSIGSASPLEHYWSLAIEEQFYWLWPIAFTGLAAVAITRARRIVALAVITTAFAVSAPVIAAVWGGDAAYWSTPARAAEILVGALLAVVVAGRTVGPRWALLAPAALAVVVAGFVLFPAAGGPAYSGALPLVGVVSAALLLGLQAEGPVRRFLGLGPLVWLGRISYGVYLYHWPIFVIVDERRTGLDGPALLLARLGLTLVVAQASFTWFEQPLRHGRPLFGRPLLGGPRSALAGVGARAGAGRRTVVAAVAATSVTIGAAMVLVPGPASDYWTASVADAEAARIEVAGETLVPLVPLDAQTSPGATDPSPGATAPSSGATDPSPGAPDPAGPTSGDPTDPATMPSVTEAAASGSTSSSGGMTNGSASSGTAPNGAGSGSTGGASNGAAPTPTDTIPPLPSELARPVRVIVAGDSTAEATGVGLVSWSAANADLGRVELRAAPGCGFVRSGAVWVQDWRPVPERCDVWLDEELPGDVGLLRPDVVLLMTTTWDVLDHRWAADERWSPLDESFRRRLERDLAEVTERLLAAGAGHVVWIRHPVPNPLWLSSGQDQEDPARHAVLHSVMDELAVAERVHVVDLADWLASQGLDTDTDLRPDGVHWSPEGSRAIADGFLAEQVLRIALGLPRP